jgi:hypothetical protein
MNLRTLTLLFVLFATGCSMNPTIIDYDPENDIPVDENGERIAYEPTPDYVVAADHKRILVEVMRDELFFDDQDEIEVQQWSVIATNNNRRDKCVGVQWRLMDFKFISEHPTPVLIHARQRLFLGTMVGRTMIIDGVTVAPPPSGYVYEMKVLDPDTDALEGDECLFLPDEEDIIQNDEDIKTR